MKTLALAIGAGLASALLYLAVSAGTLLAVPLFYLAALPIMLTGLGWGTAAGWVAAAAGTVISTLAVGPLYAAVYAIACSVPAGLLSRLAMLGRPIDPQAADSPIEWYPAGRLLFWCATFGAAIATGAMAMIDFDLGAITEMFEQMFGIADSGQAPSNLPGLPEDFDRAAFAAALAGMVPKAIAALWTAAAGINLWLAARINFTSGRLNRPLPDLADIELPAIGAMVVAIGFLASFLGGAIGIIGQVASAAFLTIYVFAGVIVVHVFTRGMTGRPAIIGALYGGLIFLTGWLAVPLALLGLADSFLSLRHRRGRTAPSNQNDHHSQNDQSSNEGE